MQVIVRALGPRDTCAVIGFESLVTTPLARTWMDSSGCDSALAALSALRPGGGTALWDGLLAGLQEVEGSPVAGPEAAQPKVSSTRRLPVVLLLTDGQPSPSPPAGEAEELRRYIAARSARLGTTHTATSCKLVTLGFGYDVNSKLLQVSRFRCSQSF